MTVASSINRNDYTGTGIVATYSYTFRILADTDLKVTTRNTLGVETALALNTNYTVTGVGKSAGGSITLLAGALTSGHKITIRRVRPLTQGTDIRNQGDFYPEVHEDSFDHGIFVAQQLQEQVDRAIKNPETVSAADFNPVLPSNMNQASRAFGTNAAANGFELGPTFAEIAAASGYGAAALASQVAAAASQTAAASSATAAASSATAASTSATNASTSATNASTSATNAANSATAAANSATAAANSATTATTQATTATTQATTATTQATTATTQATNAAASATAAANSATSASTSATNAANSATAAANSAASIPDPATLATLTGTQVLENKGYDGGVANAARYIKVPAATKAVLDALARSAGKLYWATDELKAYIDNGTTLTSVGGGNYKVSATQTIAAAGAITVTILDGLQMVRVKGTTVTTGDTASTTPFGSLAFTDGQSVTVIGQDDDYPLTIPHSDTAKGCLLNGDAVLYRGSTLSVMYDATLTRFVEVSRNA